MTKRQNKIKAFTNYDSTAAESLQEAVEVTRGLNVFCLPNYRLLLLLNY